MSKFCENCGTQLNPDVKFCASCGAAQRREDSIPPPASVPAAPVSNRLPAASRPPVPRKPLKDRIMDLLTIPIAIILILMGIASMGLTVAGKTTTAQVTGHEQVLLINNDDSTRNPSRYKLEYEFTVNTERYTGSVTRVFPGGSHMRSTIQVRYLPFWPHVNAEDNASAGLAGPVMAGVGALMLVFGMKKMFWPRNRSR